MQRQRLGTQAANVAGVESKDPGWHARCVQIRSVYRSSVPPALNQKAFKRHVSKTQCVNVDVHAMDLSYWSDNSRDDDTVDAHALMRQQVTCPSWQRLLRYRMRHASTAQACELQHSASQEHD